MDVKVKMDYINIGSNYIEHTEGHYDDQFLPSLIMLGKSYISDKDCVMVLWL